jgi:hypothetical protein
LKDHCIITSLSGAPAFAGAYRGRPYRGRIYVVMASALLMLLGLSLAGGFCQPATAQQASPRGKVLLVVIDRIGIDDLSPTDSPNILKLASRGDISLMNARVKYDQYGLGSYLVIGAGGRAIGGPNIGLAFNSTERLTTSDGGTVAAGSIYRSRTGRSAPAGSVVNPFIEEMRAKSDVTQASSKPGLLGQALIDGGRKISVLGNADATLPASPLDIPPGQDVRVPVKPLQQEPAQVELAPSGLSRVPAPGQQSYPLTSFIHRESVAMAMSAGGKVLSGNVSRDLARDSSTTGDLTTDFPALEAQAKAAMATSDLLVVDMGQTSRVDEQADFYTESRLAAARRKALRECDSSLGRLAAMTDPARDMIIVCTPTPTRKMMDDGELVTPLVISGKGFASGGQLHSATTRRTGLVSNYDIAPTILEFEGLKTPAEMDGRPVTAAGSTSDIPGLVRFQDKAAATFNARKMMVRVYVITSMCIIGLLFLVVLLRRDLIDSHPYLWSVALLAILAGPLVWLLVPMFGVLPQAALVAISVCGAILMAFAALALRQRSAAEEKSPLSAALLRPMLAISSVTLLAIIADLLAGSPLMTLSTFGSDTILGDRYYGIGNLYMGFAMGAGILFGCLAVYLLREKLDAPWKKYALAGVIFAVVTVVIGIPKLGADMGGLAAMLVASLVTLLKFDGKRLTAKKVALVVVVLIVCLGAVFLVDALMPGSASHVGRAIGKAQGSGFSTLAAQAARKLGANWTLTWASIWRLLLLFSLVAFAVFNWKFSILKTLRKHYANIYAGFFGLAVGLVMAWVFNDSGIEAAGAIAVFLFVPYFLMLIHWRRKPAAPLETG